MTSNIKNESEFLITVDQDKSLEYETNSPIKVVVNIFLIPILNSIPSTFQRYIKKTHKSAEEIIEHATTHQAIEVLYQKGNKHYSRAIMHKFFHLLWFNTNNSKAIRNRLRLTKRELLKQIESLYNRNRKIKILNIASGSARAIIEIFKDFDHPNDAEISIAFLDKNEAALKYSQELIKDLDREVNAEWIQDTVNNYFANINHSIKFNLIEMVGLMDYFNDEQVVRTFTSIYDHLESDGCIISANISDNSERKFVTDTVGWNMIYRSADDFAKLIVRAGFKSEKIEIYYEPLKVHCLIKAIK